MKNRLISMLFGFGAAIVIVGFLLKVEHLSIGPINGSNMLVFGLGLEAVLFIVGGLVAPKDAAKSECKLGTIEGLNEFGEELGAAQKNLKKFNQLFK